MSDTPDEPTTESEPIAPEPAPAEPSPVRTVTRNGAALGMAACLVVGLLLGWAVSAATGDDDPQPVSFQGQFPGGGQRGEGGWQDGGFGPMGPMGPGGGGWGEHDQGGRPPWFDDDGDGRGERPDRDDDEGDETPTTTTEA